MTLLATFKEQFWIVLSGGYRLPLVRSSSVTSSAKAYKNIYIIVKTVSMNNFKQEEGNKQKLFTFQNHCASIELT